MLLMTLPTKHRACQPSREYSESRRARERVQQSDPARARECAKRVQRSNIVDALASACSRATMHALASASSVCICLATLATLLSTILATV